MNDGTAVHLLCLRTLVSNSVVERCRRTLSWNVTKGGSRSPGAALVDVWVDV